jgi:hypothetical protein
MVMRYERRGEAKWRRPRRRALERLECRRLLCLEPHPLADELSEMGTAPALEALPAVPAAGTEGAGGTVGAAAKLPLSSIPELNSLPDAEATLYLDFDGHFEERWGSFRNVRTPAFDLDGDPLTFTQTELARIRQIWEYVAEDYAPFRLNVTTVEPPSFADGVALRVAIGGDGLWSGGKYGGVAYVDSFTNYLPNTVYVFSKNLGGGNARFVADAASHESGHGFGLYHQSRYRDTTKIDEYYKGPGDGRAPLMGNSFAATRSLWWLGTSAVSYRHIQDDMEHIARRTNGFGYRPDDHGNSMRLASELSVSGSTATGAGVIEQTTDTDYFAFYTGRGRIHFTVSVAPDVNNLDATLKLLDNQGRVIAAADPSNSFNATVTANITRAGKYYVVVGSHGLYGDVGQYTLRGSIVPQRTRDLSEPAAEFGPLASNAVQFGKSQAPPAPAGLLRGEAADGSLSDQPAAYASAAAGIAAGPAPAAAHTAKGLVLLVGTSASSTAAAETSTEATRSQDMPSQRPSHSTSHQPARRVLESTALLAEASLPVSRLLDPARKLPAKRSGAEGSLRPPERLSPQLVDRVMETWWS